MREGKMAKQLLIAVQRRQERLVDLFILRGAAADASDLGGWSPLHYAVEWGSMAVVKSLCDAGADKDKAMQDDTTPLYIAS
ncbi:MAG: ankyrin repeat domain-containing protein, partial [Candidatus Thermoplasmatota archaeon]|nr:ankyrin repeat domain-containing protein [Candidatus Thermoplasmatota archaeon]